MANEWRVCTFKVYKRTFLAGCRQQPYHVESTGSRPITEVKQRRARLVLGWVTAWEHRVLLATFFVCFSSFFLSFFYLFMVFWFIDFKFKAPFLLTVWMSLCLCLSLFFFFSFFFFFFFFFVLYFYPGGLVVKINHPSHSLIDLCPVSYREPQCLFSSLFPSFPDSLSLSLFFFFFPYRPDITVPVDWS